MQKKKKLIEVENEQNANKKEFNRFVHKFSKNIQIK